jgi:hypothetical protein
MQWRGPVGIRVVTGRRSVCGVWSAYERFMKPKARRAHRVRLSVQARESEINTRDAGPSIE